MVYDGIYEFYLTSCVKKYTDSKLPQLDKNHDILSQTMSDSFYHMFCPYFVDFYAKLQMLLKYKYVKSHGELCHRSVKSKTYHTLS